MFLVLFICVCLLVAYFFFFYLPIFYFIFSSSYYFFVFSFFFLCFLISSSLSPPFFFKRFFLFFNCIWNNFNYQLGVIFWWAFGWRGLRMTMMGDGLEMVVKKPIWHLWHPLCWTPCVSYMGSQPLLGNSYFFKKTVNFNSY